MGSSSQPIHLPSWMHPHPILTPTPTPPHPQAMPREGGALTLPEGVLHMLPILAALLGGAAAVIPGPLEMPALAAHAAARSRVSRWAASVTNRWCVGCTYVANSQRAYQGLDVLDDEDVACSGRCFAELGRLEHYQHQRVRSALRYGWYSHVARAFFRWPGVLPLEVWGMLSHVPPEGWEQAMLAGWGMEDPAAIQAALAEGHGGPAPMEGVAFTGS